MRVVWAIRATTSGQPVPSHSESRSCAADRVPRRVIDAISREHNSSTHDDGHTDCFYAGLFLAAFDALLDDEEALHRLRRGYLTSPPHGVKHEPPAQAAHMRAALVAALNEVPDAG